MEAWKEEIASGKLPFESAAAVGAAGKGAVKREKKVSQFAPGYAQWRIFRHFRQYIFAYFS